MSSLFFMTFEYISPLQGLFLEFAIFSTNVFAALPLKKAAVPPLKLWRHAESSKIFVARKLHG